MADYYSVMADAIFRMRSKNDESRRAIYERARRALRERLRTLDPPISETVLANEQVARLTRPFAEWKRICLGNLELLRRILIKAATYLLLGLVR
jgi:hypothetical protein